jgi:hypothetical protein
MDRAAGTSTATGKTRVRLLVAAIVLAGLIPRAGVGAEPLVYTVKPGDTLESVAALVYAALPGAEANPADNRFRGALLFLGNRDRLSLSLQFHGDDWEPVVALPAGREIEIPTPADGYQTPAALQALMSVEIEKAKRAVRAQNEALAPQTVEKQDRIETMILQEEPGGSLSLSRVAYKKKPRLLTDGAALPPADVHGDLFVRRVIENPGAEKTIFIFPTTYDGNKNGFAVYGVLCDIAAQNPGRSVVLLEGVDAVADRAVLDTVNALPARFPNLDPTAVLAAIDPRLPSSAEQRPLVAPSVALAGLGVATAARGLEDNAAFNNYRSRLGRLASEADRAFREFRGTAQKVFLAFYDPLTERFIRELEESILGAAQKRRIRDAATAAAINARQREFARLYVRDDFFGTELSPNDRAVRAVLLDLDILCGSSGSALYDAYTADVKRAWRKNTDPDTEARLKTFRDTYIKDARRELTGQRSAFIAASFSSLTPGAVGIAELNVALVADQIDLCLAKKSYNLVVYYHPDLDLADTRTPAPVDPALLGDLFGRSRSPGPLPADIVLPPGYVPAVDWPRAAAALIREKFLRWRTAPAAAQDIGKGQASLAIEEIAGAGMLLKITGRGNNDTLFTHYYFIPGTTDAQRKETALALITSGTVSGLERSVLENAFNIMAASKNL